MSQWEKWTTIVLEYMVITMMGTSLQEVRRMDVRIWMCKGHVHRLKTIILYRIDELVVIIPVYRAQICDVIYLRHKNPVQSDWQIDSDAYWTLVEIIISIMHLTYFN